MYRSILVPLDGSEHSQTALEVAHKLAATDAARLHLVHVSDVRPRREIPGGIDVAASAMASGMTFTPEEIEQMDRSLAEQIERAERAGLELIARAKRAAGLADVETQDIVRMGPPADVILELAEELGVDAIVMGSRGMSKLASLVVGSVSHKVMHAAECRVVLVH
jgi:nucleotide-binding universal stress UspA family protein